MKTTVMTTIHVHSDGDIVMRVDECKLFNNRKFATLTLENAAIFINNRKKALEIASLLIQASQELEDENELN